METILFYANSDYSGITISNKPHTHSVTHTHIVHLKNVKRQYQLVYIYARYGIHYNENVAFMLENNPQNEKKNEMNEAGTRAFCIVFWSAFYGFP